jgi:hypothetical protein
LLREKGKKACREVGSDKFGKLASFVFFVFVVGRGWMGTS